MNYSRHIIIFTFYVIPNYILNVTSNSQTSVGEPLILTQLIKSGKINEAREKSRVRPFLPGIFSSSGFLTVNSTVNANIYFWFFQKTNSNWEKAPVLLWLQGGPGCSSMFAIFTENGPYDISRRNKIKKRKYSWTNEYNVLFIDNPIGAGFSFADNYFVRTEEEVGDHLYEALLQFFQLYPELARNKFYLTGESYAGKYIPAIAYKIYKSNPNSQLKINLKGLLIGNGRTDTENMQNSAEHVHRLGLIDYRTRVQLEVIQEDNRILMRNKNWQEALQGHFNVLSTIKNNTQFEHLYHYSKENIPDEPYLDFLQENSTRKAIHVGALPYEDCSESVFQNMKTDIVKSVQPWIEELLEEYRILFFSGQMDLQIAHYLTNDFIEQLHWSGAEDYSISSRKKLYLGDHLIGYLNSAGNLKVALIRNAGHMVPIFQPRAMLSLIDKFIKNEI